MTLRPKSMRKKRGGIILLLFISVLIICAKAESGIVYPRNGGRLPSDVVKLLEENKGLFTLEHRWAYRKMLGRGEGASRGPILTFSSGMKGATGGVISGDLNIPVLMGLYSDSAYTAESAADSAVFHGALFSGPSETGTMNDYYNEVSLGLLNVEGDLYGWVPLSGSEKYYTGGFQNWGLDPVDSRTGEFISDAVTGVDPYVDFGEYDNDGPDGIPNSGDDDGYVDILFIVTPTRGAECDWFTNHMWSHSASFSIWDESGEPLYTNDRSANGGSILIEDYIIGPTVSCNSDSLIEIGLFCHELGHMLGLPDLYDTGPGAGIGNWGIMGRGAVDHPESPAHPCAWSKQQLGWVNVIDVGWRERKITLEPVALSGEVVRMNLPDARFKRRFCGSGESGYSLLCACGEGEAEARGWPDDYGAGYGNGWEESMTRGFSLNNSSACSLSYSVTADLEEGYDFGYTLLEAGGTTDTLAAYTGRILYPDEMIVLSDYLPEDQSDFTLRFLFLSDFNNSDEDGGYDSDGCRVFSIDNISVKGGGLDYYSDFETDAGGWRCDTLSSEYFLVSYRDKRGFDRYLPGEGLLVWHAENSIAYSELKNSGGSSDEQARGVVLEEADGDYDILSGDNYGDRFDPFPGGTGKTSFRSETTPDSRSNGGFVTPVSIRGIQTGYGYIEAFFRAGSPRPVLSTVTPDTVIKDDSGGEFYLDITGENILPPVVCRLQAQKGYIEALD
ncbi:MAG TPA: M6 family metalloprotease domain-containing protein, partial [Candidatus Krumholzibacteriaceae bacterium]|nr:M6 family metalloprotease domain-containing protein [Candidatus Krumholzibacteriaceae bacterium]